VSGTCQPGVPAVCDDGNGCTDDSCHPTLGCQHAPNTNACDDGSACTTLDACSGGECLGSPVVCDDGDACNGVETCDGGTGTCLTGTPPVCVAPDSCTIASCDPIEGCQLVDVPDVALCTLDVLLAEVTGASPGDIGGLRRQARLTHKIAAVREKVQMALDRPARRTRMAKTGNRILSSLQRTLRRGAQQGKYESTLANRLITLASEAMIEVRALLTP
jgi:hypothetical protein